MIPTRHLVLFSGYLLGGGLAVVGLGLLIGSNLWHGTVVTAVGVLVLTAVIIVRHLMAVEDRNWKRERPH